MPRPPRIFLRAEWRNLVIVSYHVPETLLAPHLPKGLELDPIEDTPAASLVAFQFLNTRVWGVPWPGFVNFPEWNLRFYVKTKERAPRRGVVFIREFVPSRIVSRIARQLYNEPYAAAPMVFTTSRCSDHASRYPDHIEASCTIVFNGAGHSLGGVALPTLHTPHDSTTEHLLKEHQWGFGQTKGGKTLMYEVVHPTWRIHEHAMLHARVDWARLYGTEWGVMQGATPFSAILAEGSAISVATATALE